ncbi:type-1Ba cytolytic delta-endotoxin [Endozoicomonas sp. SM1973]|uniref:Type-1Ba cytolytic delta-endotoxin n=1 Tax=Spartinivicinus marinus TaxID=2994442 RepID=A0A853I8U9_9GAMM|nr:hypothetical protein [Spartinivicinus marinus]NYZ67068.1 type-1Ba cytolytic delta-endotoxin [Spartinivicinus marinus]
MSIEIHPNKTTQSPFQLFLNLEDEKYVQQATAIADLFEKDVDVNGRFDLEKALATAKGQPDLAIMSTNNTTLKKSYSTLSAITSSISDALESQGTIGITDNKQLSNVLAHAFCDLQLQEGKPWFHITSTAGREADKTVYSYDMFIVTQGASTGSVIAAGPLTLKVTVNDPIEEILGKKDTTKKLRLTLKEQEMTIEIKGFQFVVPLI